MAEINCEISVKDIDIVRRLLKVLIENVDQLPEPVLCLLGEMASEVDVMNELNIDLV